ncbi:MAG: hypothetical protein Q4B30_06925 [Coriobacteriaceae bacterium]|nr:hypothetical protein [Coriobacteriaceae bacterium]
MVVKPNVALTYDGIAFFTSFKNCQLLIDRLEDLGGSVIFLAEKILE